jgi:hypothetical protein
MKRRIFYLIDFFKLFREISICLRFFLFKIKNKDVLKKEQDIQSNEKKGKLN